MIPALNLSHSLRLHLAQALEKVGQVIVVVVIVVLKTVDLHALSSDSLTSVSLSEYSQKDSPKNFGRLKAAPRLLKASV